MSWQRFPALQHAACSVVTHLPLMLSALPPRWRGTGSGVWYLCVLLTYEARCWLPIPCCSHGMSVEPGQKRSSPEPTAVSAQLWQCAFLHLICCGLHPTLLRSLQAASWGSSDNWCLTCHFPSVFGRGCVFPCSILVSRCQHYMCVWKQWQTISDLKHLQSEQAMHVRAEKCKRSQISHSLCFLSTQWKLR